jgi:hypothetical protein
MSKIVIQAAWDDAPHLDASAKAALATSYRLHERDARMRGVPSIGSGAIYPVPEGDILIDPFIIPNFYRRVYAMDVGWKRTAALWGAYNPDDDVLYLVSEYYRGEVEPAVHVQAIKSRGDWIPGVIDPAARGRGQKDGDQLYRMYIELGLTLSPAINAVESGIYEVYSRLSSGRLKVFRTLTNFMAEYRIYRRDEKGAVVKDNDHLMDCMRYMVMSGIDCSAQMPIDMVASRTHKHEYSYDPYGRQQPS